MEDKLREIVNKLHSRKQAAESLRFEFAHNEEYWKAEAMKCKRDELSYVLKMLNQLLESC